MRAQVNDGPCVMYVGPGGAGNFVKMVHNGIEYGDMQLISEAYDVLKTVGGAVQRGAGCGLQRVERGAARAALLGVYACHPRVPAAVHTRVWKLILVVTLCPFAVHTEA